MARPLKNNADYFPHDNDMRNNARVKALRSRHGIEAYAVWCMLLETLTNAHNFTLDVDELTVEIMAGDFGVDVEYLQQVLNSCSRLQLIQYTQTSIQCASLVERMKPLEVKRERKRVWIEQFRKSTNRDVDGYNKDVDSKESPTTHKDKDKDKGKGKGKDRSDVIGKTPPPPQFDESQSIKNLSNSVADFFASPEEGSIDFQKIEKFRAAFEREMKATGKKHDSERDLIQHFIFWVRKKSNGGGAKAGPAPSAGVNRRAGVNDIRMTEEDYNRPQYF